MGRIQFASVILVLYQLFGIVMLYSVDDKARYDYYNQLFEKFFFNINVKIMMDDKGPFLRALKDITSETYMFHMPKKLAIQGCFSYPFKDVIAKAIEDYYLINRPNRPRLTQFYLLAYQILYYQFADHDAVKQILLKDEYISEIYSWKPDPLILEYIKILLKSKINSIFSMSETEIRFGESLGFDMTAYYDAKEIFSIVKKVALDIEDPDIGV